MFPDWQIADHYEALTRAERKAMAWEWLRRTDSYIKSWTEFRDNLRCHRTAQIFGLERFENPALMTPQARPIWSSKFDESVVRAVVARDGNWNRDCVDLSSLRPLVTISIDEDDIEHILLSDGSRTLRLDIEEGTLIGCPSPLSYHLSDWTVRRTPLG